jgi:hypothetical protein
MTSARLPKPVWCFTREVLVECPRCQGCALVRKATHNEKPQLTCATCGYAASEFTPRGSWQGRYKGVDPWLGLPLWLRDHIGGKPVWAYNWAHLEDLEYFLTGDWRAARAGRSVRTGSPHSYNTRLPQWMHLKTNQADLLRAIRRMKRRRG